MKKILITFLMILCIIALSGCDISKPNENNLGLKEKETLEYVKVRYSTVTGGMNSIPWSIPLEFYFDNETISYEMIVYKNNDFKNVVSEKFEYNGEKCQIAAFKSNTYVDITYANIIIYEENKIIGYAIISSYYNRSIGRKYTYMEKQVLFLEVIRNKKEVSRESVIELIKQQNEEYIERDKNV